MIQASIENDGMFQHLIVIGPGARDSIIVNDEILKIIASAIKKYFKEQEPESEIATSSAHSLIEKAAGDCWHCGGNCLSGVDDGCPICLDYMKYLEAENK